jgi:short-subunit dehydrogenase
MTARHVMIIGGTSGIGLGLARHYAALGARVAICGRHPDKVAGLPLLRDGGVSVHACDIADRDRVAAVVAEFAAQGLDLLIVTAGQYTDATAIAQDAGSTLPVLRVNVGGLDHAFGAGAEAMMARAAGTSGATATAASANGGGSDAVAGAAAIAGAAAATASRRGHLVAVASIAGLQRDHAGGSVYSASKRAAIAICDAYRKALAPFAIDVTVIVPGYVDTARLRELNDGDASGKPFLMAEEEAVRRIAAAIARRDERHVFPWQMHVLVRLFNLLPPALMRLRKR